ncbi:MAG: carboxypeptidase-like regulatory domain-containing protein [Bacteroidota bacterium]
MPRTTGLSGVILSSNGQPLSSANVQVLSIGKVMPSGIEGRFSIIHPTGKVQVEISYTGFKRFTQAFSIRNDTTVYFILEPKIEELDEVVISSNRMLQTEQFKTTRMSTVNLNEKDITSIPVFGGEADLLKIIQLLLVFRKESREAPICLFVEVRLTRTLSCLTAPRSIIPGTCSDFFRYSIQIYSRVLSTSAGLSLHNMAEDFLPSLM